MEPSPIEALWALVQDQRGPATRWHYSDLYNHRKRYLADLQVVKKLAPAGAILEVGSSPCHMTGLLKLSGYEVVGVDLEPNRVADFIERLDLDVRRCDIERSALPFEDDSFECVMLCETFEHLRIDPAFVLSEINRVMVADATLMLTTPNVYSLPSLARFFTGRSIADPATEFGKLRGIGHMGHVREYSGREVARFLEASGFEVQSINYRYHRNSSGWQRRLLEIGYRLTPRWFRRELVVVAKKARGSRRLSPLVPKLP